VNGEWLFLAQYRFTELVQRIWNCGKLRNITLTPDKVPNVLLHESLRDDKIQ